MANDTTEKKETKKAPAKEPAKKTTKEPIQEPKIGTDGVNRLVNLYLGRKANMQELERFESVAGEDISILKEYLIGLKEQEKIVANTERELQNQKTKMDTDARNQQMKMETDAQMAEQKNKQMEAQMQMKAQAQAQLQPQGQDGMGGPGTSGLSEDYLFDGDELLVRFTDDPTPTDNQQDANSTVWFYDRKAGTYRPFLSMDGLAKWSGLTIEEIAPYISDMPTTTLSDPQWKGKFIARKDGIDNDGIEPESSQFVYTAGPEDTPINLTYGQDITPEDASIVVQVTEQFIDNMASFLVDNGMLNQETVDKYLNDDTSIKGYVSAIGFGNYQVSDIYADLKAKELADAGDTEYQGYEGFSRQMKASEWYKTEEYKQMINDKNLRLPANLKINPNLLYSSLFDIPVEAFEGMTEPLDINSPEFKKEAEEILASYYDITMQTAEAITEQDKMVADKNYEVFKNNLNKKYGIQLSNNARAAWGQIQQIISGHAQRGLANSGILNEATDKYLGDVRRTNEQLRESKMDEAEGEQRMQLLNNGSDKEIAAFIKANPEKAVSWGLVPSQETIDFFNPDNLREKYPDMSDDEIDIVSNMFIDGNNNYKSRIQQKLYQNKYEIFQKKQGYQITKLANDRLREDELAMKQFTTGSPFLEGGLREWREKYGEADDVDASGEVKTDGSATDNTTPDYTAVYKEYGLDINPSELKHHQDNLTGESVLRDWLKENKATLLGDRLKNSGVDTSTDNASKRYARYSGSGDVYDTQNNNQYVGYDYAKKNKIWDQVQDYDYAKPADSVTIQDDKTGGYTEDASNAAGNIIKENTVKETKPGTWTPGYAGSVAEAAKNTSSNNVQESSTEQPKSTFKPMSYGKKWDYKTGKWVPK